MPKYQLACQVTVSRDIPVLFSHPMVRAILAGRKTQTRRIVKPQPEERLWAIWQRFPNQQDIARWRPGDRLWVREAFAFINNSEFGEPSYYQYRADTDGKCLPGNWPDEERDNPDRPKWRPSIYMPRAASRIMLLAEAVRVERLQQITDEDCRAEGVYWSETFDGWCGGRGPDETVDFHQRLPVRSYEKLWEAINGPGSWDANPWVTVTTFSQIANAGPRYP